MNIKWQFAQFVSWAHSKITSPAQHDCRILMYHAVGSQVPADLAGRYSLAPSLFATHVVSLGASCVSPFSEIREGTTGVVLTFDDGFRDIMDVAAPLLEKANIPYTVFVTPDFATSGDPRYLCPGDLKILAAFPGAGIGAHGKSHCRLTECDDAELTSELRGSRAWLEDLLGREVDTMSYPHGAVDERVRDAVQDAGYRLAATSCFAPANCAEDPLRLARIDIWAQDSERVLRAKLDGYWDWIQKLR
jgi:hypothetical protein